MEYTWDEDKTADDDLRSEYDDALLRQMLANGVRGKYAERARQSTNIVKLAPDVAAAFPNAEAINAALRRLLPEQVA